jgi:putative membrane protein
VLSAAAHGILARHLYATGWGAGAMVMYYGGDVVEVTLAALLCREWLAAPRPAGRGLSTAHPG